MLVMSSVMLARDKYAGGGVRRFNPPCETAGPPNKEKSPLSIALSQLCDVVARHSYPFQWHSAGI